MEGNNVKRKTVEDLLREKGVTPEEAERLGLTELIKECKERERVISEISETTRDNLATFFGHLEDIGRKMQEAVEAIGNITLASMPESEFHRE